MKKEPIELYFLDEYLYKRVDCYNEDLDKNRLKLNQVDLILFENLIDNYIDENKNVKNLFLTDCEYEGAYNILFFLIVNEKYNLSEKLIEFLFSINENILGPGLLEELFYSSKKKNIRDKFKFVISKSYQFQIQMRNKNNFHYKFEDLFHNLVGWMRYEYDFSEIFKEVEFELESKYRILKVNKLKELINERRVG